MGATNRLPRTRPPNVLVLHKQMSATNLTLSPASAVGHAWCWEVRPYVGFEFRFVDAAGGFPLRVLRRRVEVVRDAL